MFPAPDERPPRLSLCVPWRSPSTKLVRVDRLAGDVLVALGRRCGDIVLALRVIFVHRPRSRALSIGGPKMDEAPVLICYDGSDDADRAIETAADLLGPHRAVVLDIGPEITAAESLATASPVAPGSAFEDLNTADALQRATAGAQRAARSGFQAEARAELASPKWSGVVDVADEID